MKRVITIDPVTRISGFLNITAEVDNNRVINAKTGGLLFRGFEKMLLGRQPQDAVYFTERICGICSTSHAIASSLALQNAFNIKLSKNSMYLRDLIHGFEILQNHLRQFYFFTVPDYVKLDELSPISPQEYNDFRIPEKQSLIINQNYINNIRISRLAHEGMATLGGKAPHAHGIQIYGTTVDIDPYKIEKIRSIIHEIKNFVEGYMLEDIKVIADFYSDYFEKGGSYQNYMSYGLFDYGDPEISYVKPGVMLEGKRYKLDTMNIIEDIKYSWFLRDGITPNNENEFIDTQKEAAYSFIKAPRYGGRAMEGGPLARLMITGEYTRGASCMDRNMARVLELKKVIGIMEKLISRIDINEKVSEIKVPMDKAEASGLTDTIRGSLGHFIQIEKGLIKHYEIITPSGWNLSPMDSRGINGTAERALIGTELKNVDSPVELGRIIRSFDPCISCATHVARL